MGGGSQTPFGHKGSVDGTIPEPYGVDPSIAPGLARPQGWRVALPDGTGAWDKTGPLDTDWTAVGGGGAFPGYGATATDVAAASAGGAAATVSRSDHAHKGIFNLQQGLGILINATSPASPIIATPVGVAPSLYDQFLARARTFMGPGFAADFDDLTSNALPDWAVGAGIVADMTHGPGVWTFPNAGFTFLQKGSVSVVDGAATKWHIGGRMQMGSALAAGDEIGIRLDSGGFANGVEVGTFQAFSAAKFVFTLRRGAVLTQAVSTINLDATTFHVFELWFDGTTVFGSVDDEAPVIVGVAANCPTAAAIHPLHGVKATGTVGGIAFYLDAVYTAAERTAT